MRMRAGLLALLMLTACQAAPPPNVMSAKSAVELRAMQSRLFQTGDKPAMLRAVIATLQDLGYSIDTVAAKPGTVTATKLAQLTLTATLYRQSETATVVRANAMVRTGQQTYQVDDPEFYQRDFFDPLGRALLLTALPAPPAAAGSAADAPSAGTK